MANTIKIGNLDISSFKVGGANCSIYLGDVKLYPQINLPYDAEIEYLQGDIKAYMVLPFVGYSDKTTFEVSFIKNVGGDALIGSRIETNKRFCWALTYPFYQVGYGSQYRNLSLTAQNGDKMNYKSEIQNGQMVYTVSNLTTDTFANTSFPLSEFEVPEFVYLFWIGALNPSTDKVQKCVIKNDGINILDLIPVRVGSTGYMYDKVSGQLFGNSGTGKFILGADKN